MLARPLLVILQPTPFCNIDCRYCYLPDRGSNARMAMTTLRSISAFLRTQPAVGKGVEVVWHAGEPLVVGVGFYRQALSVLREHLPETHIENVIQTNGTLITQEWCDFFSEAGISLGVSLDGPATIHDAYRVDRRGRGTFERTAQGIALLRENDIPFTVLTVLTDRALDDPDALWESYVSLGVRSVAFNVEEIEGENVRSSLQAPEMDLRYRAFIRRILELWFKQDPASRIRIREVEWFLGSIQAEERITAAQTNTPFQIFTFDYEGRFSTFSPELLATRHPDFGHFIFGDVRIPGSTGAQGAFPQVNEAVQLGVARCRQTCEYFDLCGGGPPVNKLCENGSFASTETMYCRLRVKATADEMLTFFESRIALRPDARSSPAESA